MNIELLVLASLLSSGAPNEPYPTKGRVGTQKVYEKATAFDSVAEEVFAYEGYPPYAAAVLDEINIIRELDVHRIQLHIGAGTGVDRRFEQYPQEFIPSLALFFPNFGGIGPGVTYYGAPEAIARLDLVKSTQLESVRKLAEDEGKQLDEQIKRNRAEQTVRGKAIESARSDLAETKKALAELNNKTARTPEDELSKRRLEDDLEVFHARIATGEDLRRAADHEFKTLQSRRAALTAVPARINQQQAHITKWKNYLQNSDRFWHQLGFTLGVPLANLFTQRPRFVGGLTYMLPRVDFGITVGLLFAPAPTGLEAKSPWYIGLNYDTNAFHLFHQRPGYQPGPREPELPTP